MSLPFFFVNDLNEKQVMLDEDTSKHISVLRMTKGDQVLLTDGKGSKATATIIDDHRKRCLVEILAIEKEEEKKRKVGIGISLIKNASRFEWFLEKATEIGVNEIIPLLCERTEKEKFRHDRMQNILISAMLQSQQVWLPALHQPTPFEQAIQLPFKEKFIAHCEPSNRQELATYASPAAAGSLILIGPEGDFSSDEIHLAIQNNFIAVALGATRLRTETAGMVAATLLCIA